jgi:hypothetical protein
VIGDQLREVTMLKLLLLAFALFLSPSYVDQNDNANGRVRTSPVPEGGQPQVAATGHDGTVHLLFNSAEGPKYARSSDNGKTFEAAIPVVVAKPQTPGLQFEGCDMAVDKEGRVHVALSTNAWKLKLPKEEWGFYYTSLEPWAKSFAPVRNINGKPSEGYSLAADDKGTIVACWLSGKLYANVSHDGGKTFAPHVEINPAYDPCNCCTTSAVFGADGKLAVLYREETNNDRDMHMVLWDQVHSQSARTRISGATWKIDACPMTYYAVARNKDGFTAIWPTKGQIYLARLDGQGNLVSPGEIKTPGIAGMRTGMLALSAPGGNTLAAWRQDDCVKWQLYSPGGQPIGSAGSAKSAGTGVAGVVDKNGQFILFR